jgi:hypothetical protein
MLTSGNVELYIPRGHQRFRHAELRQVFIAPERQTATGAILKPRN